jgi:hypothetical protein
LMGKHEEVVTTRPEDRLRQAARIFAAGAIRAALREQVSLASPEAGREVPRDGAPTGMPQEIRKAA